MKLGILMLLCAALTGVAAAQSPSPAAPASAAAPAPASSPSVIVVSGWRLECSSNAADLSCQALDRVSLRANNAVVGALSVRLSRDKKTPVLFVQVPLGIAIPNAVRVGTGSGAVQTVQILTCNRDGCFGNARLGDPLLNAMRAAKEPLHLAYESIGSDSTARTITVNLGLGGFASAYDKLH
jgi:invasion protein IalB